MSKADRKSATRVLVTRPEGAASDAMCSTLEAAGYAAVAQPLLLLEPLESLGLEQRQCLLSLADYQHVIFISTNAVRYGMEHIHDYWPQLPVGLHWYAIGQATASALGAHGIQAMQPQGSVDSEGLLRLPTLQQVSGERVLIVKGEGGRDALRSALYNRGAEVDLLPCYQRRSPAFASGAMASLLREQNIDVVLLTSGEGFAHLQAALAPAETSNFNALCLIVPSQRVARMAQAAGFHTVITADNASDAAMLAALEQWLISSGD